METKGTNRGLPIGLAVIVSVVIVVCNWMGILSGSSSAVTAAAQEQKGLQYIRSAVPLLAQVTSCYWTALYAANGGGNSAGLKEALDKGDQLLKELEKQDQALGADLQFTKEGLLKRHRGEASFANVQNIWQQFRDGCNNPRGSNLEVNYEKLAQLLTLMITHATDTSGLVLDSTLDSYYLMSGIAVELPHAHEQLARMGATLNALLTHSKLSGQDRNEFHLQTAQFDDICDRIYSCIQTASEENQSGATLNSTHGARPGMQTLAGTLKDFTEAADEVLGKLRNAAEGDTNWKEWNKAAVSLCAASEKLFSAAAPELEGMLEAKASHCRKQRLYEWVALALALGGVWAMALMPRKPEQKMEIKINRTIPLEEIKDPKAAEEAKKPSAVTVKTKVEPKAGGGKLPDNVLFTGINSHSMIVEVMQMLHRLRKTGKMTLQSEDHTFNVYFERGRVVHADSTRFMRGEPSFQMSIRMSMGTYQFFELQELGVDQTINGNTDHLIMEAVRLMDEGKSVEPIAMPK
jgi:hypothetical protein